MLRCGTAGTTGDDPLLLYSPAILLGAGLAVVYLVGRRGARRGPGSGAAGGSTERGLLAMRAVAVAAAGCVRASVPVRLLLLAGLGLGVALTAVETLAAPSSDLLGSAAGNPTLLGVLVAASMLCVALRRLAQRRGCRCAWAAGAHAVRRRRADGRRRAERARASGGAPAFAVAFVAFYGVLGVIEPLHLELLHEEVPSGARATMLSVESLAEQLGGVTSSLTLTRLAAGAGIPAAFWVAWARA